MARYVAMEEFFAAAEGSAQFSVFSPQQQAAEEVLPSPFTSRQQQQMESLDSSCADPSSSVNENTPSSQQHTQKNLKCAFKRKANFVTAAITAFPPTPLSAAKRRTPSNPLPYDKQQRQTATGTPFSPSNAPSARQMQSPYGVNSSKAGSSSSNFVAYNSPASFIPRHAANHSFASTLPDASGESGQQNFHGVSPTTFVTPLPQDGRNIFSPTEASTALSSANLSANNNYNNVQNQPPKALDYTQQKLSEQIDRFHKKLCGKSCSSSTAPLALVKPKAAASPRDPLAVSSFNRSGDETDNYEAPILREPPSFMEVVAASREAQKPPSMFSPSQSQSDFSLPSVSPSPILKSQKQTNSNTAIARLLGAASQISRAAGVAPPSLTTPQGGPDAEFLSPFEKNLPPAENEKLTAVLVDAESAEDELARESAKASEEAAVVSHPRRLSLFSNSTEEPFETKPFDFKDEGGKYLSKSGKYSSSEEEGEQNLCAPVDTSQQKNGNTSSSKTK
eukprot:GDKK01056447.1.p1 GENE.GDKK01056447.1~~GDKK01056447.1.p1  ORF type:complete len:506 (-),score=164.07 GDKK01056447.1:169-1686(-)